MSVLNVILLVLIFSLIITMCILIRCLKNMCLINQDLHDNIINNTDEHEVLQKQIEVQERAYEELANAYVLKDVAHSIIFMLLNLSYNNEEKYSFYFNSLYFFGVPKESLEDMEQIMIFHNNCLNNKYVLIDGEKPFKYQFILKEDIENINERNENEENND